MGPGGPEHKELEFFFLSDAAAFVFFLNLHLLSIIRFIS